MRTNTMRNNTMQSSTRIVAALLGSTLIALCIGEAQAQTSGGATLDIDGKRFHRRAVEAAYWGMPLVNLWAMREGFKRDAGAGYNAVT